jgi:hypothetical protein
MLSQALNLNKRNMMSMMGLLKPVQMVDTQTASFFFQMKKQGIQSQGVTRDQAKRFFSISSSDESDGEHG